MSLWGRLVGAFYGARSGWQGSSALSQYGSPLWNHDDYATRLSDYAVFEAYLNNEVYRNIRFFSDALKTNRKYYKWIDGVFNPIKRENDLYASNVYSGSLDAEDLGAGALPLAFDNAALEEPLQQIMKWSNLGQHLSRYTSEAALYGDAAWWIVDDPKRRRVRLELLHPSKIREVDLDEVGNVRACVIEYEKAETPDVEGYQPRRFASATPQTSKNYVYTLKATKDDERSVHFETFKDGEPFAYYEDAAGNKVADWFADYPFVPLKLAAFEPAEDGWGRNSFYASRNKIDQVNSVASQLNASVRRVIEPILLAKNVRVNEDSSGKRTLDFSSQRDNATDVSTLFVNGENVDIQPLVVPLDLAAALAHVERMLLEIEQDMPVLALQRIREHGALTAPGVRSGYSDAIGRVESARKNLDPPLAAALQMAVTVGAIQGYDGFQGFSANSYDDGDMDLRVKKRTVMPDELTTVERLNAYGTVKDLTPGLQRQALKDMGVPKSEIDAILKEKADADQQQQQTAQNQINDADANSVEALLSQLSGGDQQQQPNGVPEQQQVPV